jgi:hypothetical protein
MLEGGKLADPDKKPQRERANNELYSYDFQGEVKQSFQKLELDTLLISHLQYFVVLASN